MPPGMGYSRAAAGGAFGKIPKSTGSSALSSAALPLIGLGVSTAGSLIAKNNPEAAQGIATATSAGSGALAGAPLGPGGVAAGAILGGVAGWFGADSDEEEPPRVYPMISA